MFAVKCALFLCVAVSVIAFELGPQDVVFHLFSRSNPQTSEPLLPTTDSIMGSGFNPQRLTVFTIHSNNDTVGGNFNAFVVPMHLLAEDVNIIAIDWSRGSRMYTQGLGNSPQCGERVAQFINILINQFSYSVKQVRIVGVGLGGHVAGIAARNVDGNVPHIFALDPSLVGWTHNPDILTPDDADMVEVIHTTAGYLGYDNPLGDIDFYPGGGSFQNGCFGDIDCSHQMSYIFYAESVNQTIVGGSTFLGTKCADLEEATTGACSGARDATFGGIDVKESGSGIYSFFTNFIPPFARG